MLLFVDGDIGERETAVEESYEPRSSRFGSIDVLVNNAGIYRSKPFTEYAADDFDALVSVNLRGFVNVTQLAVKQMLAQRGRARSSASPHVAADHPIAGVDAAVSMMTKGGVSTMTCSLAIEGTSEGWPPLQRRRTRRREHAPAQGRPP